MLTDRISDQFDPKHWIHLEKSNLGKSVIPSKIWIPEHRYPEFRIAKFAFRVRPIKDRLSEIDAQSRINGSNNFLIKYLTYLSYLVIMELFINMPFSRIFENRISKPDTEFLD